MKRRLAEGQITAKEAAELTGRSNATIRSWVHRQRLTAIGYGPRGVAYFEMIDVLNAERLARTNDTRRGPDVPLQAPPNDLGH